MAATAATFKVSAFLALAQHHGPKAAKQDTLKWFLKSFLECYINALSMVPAIFLRLSMHMQRSSEQSVQSIDYKQEWMWIHSKISRMWFHATHWPSKASIGQGYQAKPSISIHSIDMTYQTHCYDAEVNNVPHNAITSIKVSDNK